MASGASSILVRRLASVYPVGLSLKAWQAWLAAVAQLVECVLGKDEVVGSSPTSSFLLWFVSVRAPRVGVPMLVCLELFCRAFLRVLA